MDFCDNDLDSSMPRFLGALIAGFGLLLTGAPTIANDDTSLDLATRTVYYRIKFNLNADATLSETREWATQVLKPSAIDSVKRESVSFSTSVQKAEVITAYTLKANGNRIDVPKDNYQVRVNTGLRPGQPVFSDYSSISVVFPDLAVGDTVVFAYRIDQSEAIFPNQFSFSQSFPRAAAIDAASVAIEYPDSMRVQYRHTEMNERVTPLENGRRQIEWTYANPNPVRDQRRDYSVFDPDKEVGVSFSTFGSYADIANAYGARALPKALPSSRIKALAAEIVGKANTTRAKAKLIYEWVATHITYAGNCVGVGTVVPHDLDFVLDNKMGDCKDHATLLQALLAAQDIDSHQVLINAGSIYRLPQIPVVSNINHVINYIPALDLYLDATSHSTPFGMLPVGARGKPVLHVGHDVPEARTPTPKVASEERSISRLKIGEDGSMSGTLEVKLKGDAAVSAREWARDLSRDAERDLIRDVFRSRGMIASGKIEKEDPSALEDHYSMTFRFDKVEKYLKRSKSGAFVLFPPLGAYSIAESIPSDDGEKIEHDTVCTSGTVVEEYVIELPKSMKILSMPDNVSLKSSLQSYEARYKLKGNVLSARRDFNDRTPTSICSPKVQQEYLRLGNPIAENLSTQILYR